MSTEKPARQVYFEQQRAMLIGEISQSMEHVLQNLNKLNLALESIISVGNEFSSVEALWSQFETLMGTAQRNVPHAHASGDTSVNHNGNGEATASTTMNANTLRSREDDDNYHSVHTTNPYDEDDETASQTSHDYHHVTSTQHPPDNDTSLYSAD